ncbi:MAG TPA: hypothetical protein VN653_09480 [Anaerolineales bacterium]|nr:hypothetical protein [Anaerolineales bacterium]
MQNKNRLGCLTGTGILALLITTFVIAGYAYAQGGMLYNPGPLSTKQSGEVLGGVISHAEISGDCKACHTAPWESATMADRCTVCHTTVAVQMKNVASLHGKLMHDNPNLGCRHCHSEHRGADAALTVMADTIFPHEAVGYSLNGHQRTAAGKPFTCDDCHQGDITTFAPDACQTCHSQMDISYAQAHVLAFGSDCLACHDGVDRYGKNFSHERFTFKLTGKHVDVICSQCHLDARTIADLQAAPQDCISCHRKDEPHEGRFGSDCGSCHSTSGWQPARFDHNLSVFKLEGHHAQVDCESCHLNGIFKGTPSDCFSCHEKDDHHNGQFGTDCGACHQPADWDKVTFDHNKSKFPLTGVHVGLPCVQCHTPGQFAGLSPFCASCHGDPAFHSGLFGFDCGQCHTTNNWAARYNGPHPRLSGEGGSGINHGGASCRDCHTKTLHTAACTKCHDGNNPKDGGGGGGGDN